jgi:UDP-N-acetylmuramoyl-L-alanyl-D-glutamate--2,6-diaminopimelate ligase
MMAAERHGAGTTLGELLGPLAGRHAALGVTELTLDSRAVRPGAAFVAVRGGREHGARYAADALARGAAVVLYEPETGLAVPEPSIAVPSLKARLPAIARAVYALGAEPKITAVTGTNGKTTVAYLLAQTLALPERPCAYIGTLGYGLPPRLTAHGLTTPDCLTLHRELAELRATRVAMEVSSHALAQDRIAGLAIDTAVFTNLTRDHLDEHGDFASYGRAKARLFRLPGLRHAVVNADDPFAATLAAGLPAGCELVRASLRAAADLAAELRSAGLAGVELAIRGRFGRATLRSRLIGDFNAENLLVTLGALLVDGMALPRAVEALGAAQPAPGRMEVLGGPPGRPWVVIDYAHTPDALERVLTTLKAIAGLPLWCVFGCGGDRDRGKRPLMGAIAARLADHVVVTDDNPRTEDPAQIVADIRAGIAAHPSVTVEHDRRRAIADTIGRARPGEIVVVAGKGHEAMQIVGAAQRPFSDRAVARQALGAGS